MAKKNFKKGLGSLIQDTRKKSKQADEKTIEHYENMIADLKTRIEWQETELYKWRTGELTQELFSKSIEEHGLKYDASTNSFEIVEEKK